MSDPDAMSVQAWWMKFRPLRRFLLVVAGAVGLLNIPASIREALGVLDLLGKLAPWWGLIAFAVVGLLLSYGPGVVACRFF